MNRNQLYDAAQRGEFPSSGHMFSVVNSAGSLFAWGSAAPSTVNVYAPGGLFLDTTNKKLYQNTGTYASPSFTGPTFGGAATFDSTVGVTGNFAVNTNKFTVTAASGNTLAAGTLSATGDFAVNTNKFTVTASSGNTLAAGTLSATGDFAVNTNKFTVAAASGNTLAAGTLSATGNFAVNTDKFTVTATTGAVGIAGDITMADSTNIVVNATTGTKIGTAVSQKLGFWNAAPVVQPAHANQAEIAAATATTPGSGADGTTPNGAQYAALVADVADIRTKYNQLRLDLIAVGIIKGSA